jgi:glutathione S-transferase
MKLYYSPSACSLSPHIVAREAGIDIALDKVDNATKKTASGKDFLSINPKGYVPVLELDNGEVLTEGPTIVQYLADQNPSSRLVPAAGTLERYRQQEMLGYINSEIHKTYSPLFYPNVPAEVREERIGYLRKRFTLLAPRLEASPYLFGDVFTAADAYLFVVARWSKFVKFDLAGELPPFAAFLERVAARPAVHAALKAEGLVK